MNINDDLDFMQDVIEGRCPKCKSTPEMDSVCEYCRDDIMSGISNWGETPVSSLITCDNGTQYVVIKTDNTSMTVKKLVHV